MLNRQTILNISPANGIETPADSIFRLPEKVLQFGTGVLLRGLPDYFIDKANKQGIFNGRIVVIKSTDSGDASAFDKQDGLYTICVKGIENGVTVETDIINASISRVLSAKNDWPEVLHCAHNQELTLIISNTTEVGISLVLEDMNLIPPVSFPGKLLSFLHERYQAFNGSPESGMVIIPTELIPDNGKSLQAIVVELARFNKLQEAFIEWLQNSNHFCNSLVDRIVPGKPSAVEKATNEVRLGYQDELLIISEVYRLWAIESSSDKVKQVLSFSAADKGVAIAPDITKFRELKLRLLNGTHTLSCGLAVLAGFVTVREAMEDRDFTAYMQNLMILNIIPAIVDQNISENEARLFALDVLDRFRNPFLDHKWLSISMQYSSKMKMRNMPVLNEHYERFDTCPDYIALGFAAFMLFMKSEIGNGNHIGAAKGSVYTIQDDQAAYFNTLWKEFNHRPEVIVLEVLANKLLWGMNAALLPDFEKAVSRHLQSLIKNGAKQTIKSLLTYKPVVRYE